MFMCSLFKWFAGEETPVFGYFFLAEVGKSRTLFIL
jgi:hypothetical protein